MISSWRGNVNYEADKAAMGEGLPSSERMLARSEAKSVGHAGGSGGQRKKYTAIDVDHVIDDIKGVES